MSDVPQQGRGSTTTSAGGLSVTRETPAARQEPEATGWTGWIVFAGIMMVMVGAFQAIEGLVALFKDSYWVVPSKNLVVSVSYDTWGWVHLVVGVVILATGFGVIAGMMWARVIGVLVCLVSAVVNIAFLAAFPVWSIAIIALDVLVIYALIVHGREMKSAGA